MAKGKGGSSGSGGSGSSSCYYCNRPLYLTGWDWKSSKVDALFALECITVVALIASLVLIAKFKWTRQNGARDSARTGLFAIAGVSSIIYYLFILVTTGLQESETKTTYLYYITTIFQTLFYRIAELVILAIVLKTIVATMGSGLARGLRILNVVAITILGLLTISGFGLFTARIAYQIKEGYTHSLQKPGLQVDLAFESLYFVTIIYAAIVGFIVLIKERSLATVLMSLAVIPALFLRILLGLAYDALLYTILYGPDDVRYNLDTIDNLGWAVNYVYVLTTIVIFVGVAIIATLRPKIPSTTAYSGQQQKVEYGNAGYANPGYGHPGYGNATSVPHSY